jgi:hypothetical protein
MEADRVGHVMEFGRDAAGVYCEGGGEGEVPGRALGEVQEVDVEEGGWACCAAVEAGPGSGELNELAAIGVRIVDYFVP